MQAEKGEREIEGENGGNAARKSWRNYRGEGRVVPRAAVVRLSRGLREFFLILRCIPGAARTGGGGELRATMICREQRVTGKETGTRVDRLVDSSAKSL